MIFLIDKVVSVLENKTHSGNNITKFYVLLMYIRTISKYLTHISNNNSTLSFTCIYVQLTQKTWKLRKFFKFPTPVFHVLFSYYICNNVVTTSDK